MRTDNVYDSDNDETAEKLVVEFRPLTIEEDAPRDQEHRNQRIDEVIAFVEKQKEHDRWDQGSYHCGSSRCVAGWAQVLAHDLPETVAIYNDYITLVNGQEKLCWADDEGAIYMGLTLEEQSELFDGDNTWDRVLAVAAVIKSRSYDREMVNNRNGVAVEV
jgi:hypothetical protein